MLICDFVLFEHLCNLRCKYCFNSRKRLTIADNKLYRFNRNTETFELWKVLKTAQKDWSLILDKIVAKTDVPIIKLSGGELFVIPNMIDIILEIAGHSQVLQILTNGTLLDEETTKKFDRRNIHFQVSVDGHTLTMNRLRFQNKKHLKCILSFLKQVSKRENSVEINCVLSKYNIDQFFNFVSFVYHRLPNTIVLPRPVRGIPQYLPEIQQVSRFEKRYQKLQKDFGTTLPPNRYFQSLINILQNGHRTSLCFAPLFIISAFGDGTLRYCTCGSNKPEGDILNGDFEEINRKHYRQLRESIKHSTLPNFCKGCFTHYDIFNCFLNDNVPLSELKGFSLLNNEKVKKRLQFLKEKVIDMEKKDYERRLLFQNL